MEALRQRYSERRRIGHAARDAHLARAGVLLWVAIGCALRVWGLDAYAFSPDDALHVAEARLEFPAELLAALSREDTHPPLHYLLLRALLSLGVQGEALRIASLIPSLLLIPLLYGLGRKTGGHASGLFAAFLATFSSSLILQAQVIRPYALELVLLAGALWLVFDDRRGGERRRLAGYGVLMSLAILTHYSAVISVAAVGCVRLFQQLRGRSQRAAFDWAVLHGLLAILTTVLVWLLASSLLDSGFRRDAVGDWLAVGFPESRYIASWLGGTLAQFIYFADPPRLVPGALLGVLFVIGCLALRQRRDFELVQMFLVASGINLVLAALALYPFAGTRHALYMVPFVAPIAGTGFQWLWDKTSIRISAVEVLGVGIFAFSTLFTSVYVARLEVGRGVGSAELPLLREHYTQTLEWIEAGTKPGEILVGDKQLAYYAWYEGSMRESERLSEVVGRTRLGSRDFYYYDPAFVISTADDLARFVDGLEHVLGDSRPQSLCFASLGWRSGLLFRLATPGLADLHPQPGDQAIRSALVRAGTQAFNSGEYAGGGVVFSAPWQTLRRATRTAEPRRKRLQIFQDQVATGHDEQRGDGREQDPERE